MKKGIALLLLLVIIFVQAVPAAAEEVTQITIAASAEDAKPGDEITFTVSISGGEKCRYYGLMLEYDPEVYEMGTGECTAIGAMLSDFDPERGFVVLNNKERVPQGVLGTFTMKVREDAASGNAMVTGVSSVKSGDTAKPSAVTGANVKIIGAEQPTPTETTAPGQNISSDSQNQKAPQITKPAFTVPKATQPETTPDVQAAEDLSGTEAAELVTAPQETAVEAVSAEQNVQSVVQPENNGRSLVPAMALGAAILGVLVAVLLMIKLRRR